MNQQKDANHYRKIMGIKTVQDLIFYQYAKIIARSAFKVVNGKRAKQDHFGFIRETFRNLKTGKKSWSEITREDKQLVEAEKKCVYCGSAEDLHWEHIVPRSLVIKPECKTCNSVQGISNQIWACRKCNLLKGTTGLYQFFKLKYPDERKFYDFIPPLLEKKYLKTIYNCHKCTQTLKKEDLDGDGKLTVLDIDSIIYQ